MTAYAAFQNPTGVNLKKKYKKMYEGNGEKEKGKIT